MQTTNLDGNASSSKAASRPESPPLSTNNEKQKVTKIKVESPKIVAKEVISKKLTQNKANSPS